MVQAGFIPKEAAIKLLNFPDLKGFYSLESAAIENIEKQIEIMLDKGEYQAPEPFQNLTYGIKLMQQSYLKYKNENVEEEKLELFRQWMSDAQELLLSAQQPPAPEAAPVQGVPAAAPVTDLKPMA